MTALARHALAMAASLAASCLQRALPGFLVGVGEYKTSLRPVRDWVV